MAHLAPLKLPPAPLKLTKQGELIWVNCLIRKKSILLTPEEWVRQHLISYLHLYKGFSLAKISVEKQIQYAGFTKRWDIVVYDAAFQPFLLIECKAPEINLSEAVFRQIAVYQQKIRAPYLALSNGLAHKIYEVNLEKQQLNELADFPENC
jgi:hypothetical protein